MSKFDNYRNPNSYAATQAPPHAPPIDVAIDRMHFNNNDDQITPRSQQQQQVNSANLVDLHIYVLPSSLWSSNRNLAHNDAMKDAISAGFIRISKYKSASEIREQIYKQCLPKDIPRHFALLKSVGHNLTRIKPKQESELKVKNFVPPHTDAPEVFLLEDAPPLLQSDEFESIAPIRLNLPMSDRQSMNHLLRQSYPSELYNGLNRTDRPHQKKTISFLPESLLLNKDEVRYDPDKIKDFNKLKEEQERLRKRQAELERMRMQQIEADRLRKLREEQERLKKLRDLRALEEDHERQKQRLAELERQRKLQQEAAERQREEERKNQIATKIQSSFRAYLDRQKWREIERNQIDMYQSEKKEQQREQEETVQSLREKLDAIRQRKFELESIRDELFRHLKQIHNRITVRRKEARDLWKKKYFAEKKKTPLLEEKIDVYLKDIESSHRKMVANLEADVKNAALNGYQRESELRGSWLKSLKLQEDIYMQKRLVDQAKLKLTTDIKLRNQAESEIKALRTELAQTKMNLHELKLQVAAQQQ